MTMPNTNPSDLDRAARALEIKLMEFCTFMEDERELNRFDDIVTPALVQLRAALLPPASGVPEAEAVAWRYKPRGAHYWHYTPAPWPTAWGDTLTREPLYFLPIAETEKLGRFGHHPDRVIDFEVEVQALGDEISNRQHGFTNGTPNWDELQKRITRALTFRVGGDKGAIEAKHALRALLKAFPSPIASEPKDASLRAVAKASKTFPSASEPKDGESAEWQLSQAEIVSRYTMELIAMGCAEEEANSIKRRVEAVLKGITRTAPSGAKPGEVAEDD